jgi:hypothetical protein
MALVDDVIAKQTGFLKEFHKGKGIVLESISVKSKNKGIEDYLVRSEYNLIEPFPNWKQIEEEFNEGDGHELKWGRGNPPKFRAVLSSSALCVNNFAPFKEHCTNSKLSFLGYSGFLEKCVRFEKKLSTGISKPNLDFYFENKKTVIAIESKFTEHLGSPKPPNRQRKDRQTGIKENNLKKYLNWVELNYLPKEFHDSIIEHYYNDDKPQRLDVAQLIKHTIGLLKNCREKKKEAILVYLYWEPQNPTIDNLFAEHRHNIKMFKHRIERFIEFVPLSYPEFWGLYQDDDLLKGHIGKVRERYEFKIES